ncbi:MAG: VOC family protein [Hyphomicrobiaceae bacterium]|nr:VOC family protein [Hyphomicrobiaceae bacterium]
MTLSQSRALDHVVLPVVDLDVAAATYARLGFTVTPRARHPFGTGNRLIQLDGNFLELLSVVAPQDIPAPTATGFSFAAFNRDWADKNGEGMSMLVLRSADADADRAAFAALNLPAYDRFDFGRKAVQPDGSEREVAFSLAFTGSDLMPECGFFTCQNRFPENFWKPDYQRHANGAIRLTTVVITSKDPADHHEFLGGFSGARDLAMTSFALDVPVPGGMISVLNPQGWMARFGGGSPDFDDGARFFGLRFAVADLAATRALLAENAVATRDWHGAIIVDAPAAHGVTIAFDQA